MSSADLAIVCFLLLLPAVYAAVPEITLEKLVATIDEHEDSITDITGITCVDPDGTPTIVSLGDVQPACLNCFQVYPDCGGGAVGVGNSFCLRYLALSSTNFEFTQNNFYIIQIKCEDTSNPVEVATVAKVDLRLIPNTPPSFGSNTETATVTNTESVKAGGQVYQTVCTDINNDPLTYTLSSPSNLFSIDNNGVIRANADLSAACFNSIVFSVTCKDPYNPAVGPLTVQTTLNGANEQPVITGLNFNNDVPEDLAVGTTLGTFQITDDDSDLQCLLSTNPLASLQFFDFDTTTGDTRSVIVRTNLNYEPTSTRATNVTVTCTDNFCTSRAAFIYVRITDVNEPVTLLPEDFTLSTYEGTIALNPSWTPLDEDLNDEHTYSIVGRNVDGRFAIDPQTGQITSTIEYDVDNNNMPTTESLIIQIRDRAGLTSTATVTINIQDSNDNRPIFTTGSQTITVTDCVTNVGTTIGSPLVATDQDSDFQGNNVITYSGSSGPISVASDGRIFVGNGLTAGNTYTVNVVASDAGTFPRSLTSSPSAVITVIATECPTTPAPTTPAPATTPAPTTADPNAGGDGSNSGVSATRIRIRTTISTTANDLGGLDENLGWIVFAALLATVLLAALIYMLWRYCYASTAAFRFFAACNCGDCCGPEPPPPPPRPVRPAVRGHQPRNGNRGFWQERFPDDDYLEQPDRDRTPSPVRQEGTGPYVPYHTDPTQSWRTRGLRY